MRILAILLDIGLIIFVTIMLIMKGVPDSDAEGLLLVIFLYAVPLMNIVAILLPSDSYISLYFKRRALEEKRKIDLLEKEDDNDNK